MGSRDDLRAGLEGVPSRDHAEPQSAWPLEPATRLWSIASKNLPRRYGPREGTPSSPTLSAVASAPKIRDVASFHAFGRDLMRGWPVGQMERQSGTDRVGCSPGSPSGEVSGGGGLPPRSRIFWGASSKRQAKISWRARVATGIATQRAPRRQLPPPLAG